MCHSFWNNFFSNGSLIMREMESDHINMSHFFYIYISNIYSIFSQSKT